MTTLGLKGTLLQTVGGSSLSLADGSSGLESNAEVDVGTVGDTTLDTAGVVGLGGQVGGAGGSLRHDEGVVVDGAGHLAAAEAGADLEALGGGNAEHGVGELGLQLVEAGLA